LLNRDAEILLVEDNPHEAELITRALKKYNLANRTHHVEDGAAALDYLFGSGADGDGPNKPLPELVLLDLKLPKVDGLEVLRRIRADARTRHLLVVLLTSSAEETDVERAHALGANHYVQKPVEFEKFVETVAHLGLYWMSLDPAARQG
jgi:two-component system, response regulator